MIKFLEDPGIDIALGLQPRGGAVLDGGTEDIPGRDGGNPQLLAEDFRLRAFTGAGSA